MTITPLRPEKPSISVRVRLSVCSRSSLPPNPPVLLRARPMASSSVNEDDGLRGRAGLREQVTHATGADADDHLDELAGAHAGEWHVGLAGNGACQQCLPVPGGPTSRTPLGTAPPSRLYLLGALRKSTTSISSALASSMPATSA